MGLKVNWQAKHILAAVMETILEQKRNGLIHAMRVDNA